MPISQLYRCNRNLRCSRCYCSDADKSPTVATAVTTGNAPGKVGNEGKSGICPRKTACLECHLALYFSISLTQSAGKTKEILGAVLWHYTTLFSYQTLLSRPQILCRNYVFPRTSGFRQRLSKWICDKYTIDTGSYRHVSVFLSQVFWRWSAW